MQSYPSCSHELMPRAKVIHPAMIKKLPMWLTVLAMNCAIAGTAIGVPPNTPHDVDQSTTTVNVTADPEPKAEGAEAQRREIIHEINERGLTDYTRVLAVATIGLIIVAVAQALLFLWQLIYMRIGLRDAKRAADAARDSALSATESVAISKLAMVAGNRAFVHYNGCRWISHPQDADKRVFWRISARWLNAGNTPTRKLHVFVKHEFLDGPMDPNFQFDATMPAFTTVIAAKGEIYSLVVDIFGEDLVAVKEGKKRLYIWGVARYSDVFPESSGYVTRFCVEARNLSGDPVRVWDDTNNRFDIQFMHCERHNCMDEDCA
jgi:hypothetical protein